MSLSPTPEQSLAIDSRASEILLEAGAGTGKTSVLVARYCDRIEHDGVDPDRILAFTFTEKAAAEMRDRIRHELRRRAREAGLERDRAARLREASARLGGSWVMTIHGFCRRLLASHPVATGIDPAFAVLDRPSADRIAREAFEQALEDFLADEAGRGATPEAGDESAAQERAAREATLAGERIDSLRRTVISTHERLRGMGQLRPALPDPPAPDPWRACDELERAARDYFDGDGRRHRPSDEKIAAAVEIATGDRSWIEAEPAVKLAELERLSLNTDSGPRAEVAAAMRRLVACLVEIEEGLARYRHLAELLRTFTRRFEERKRARSGLDFEDLQLMATELLRDHPAIGETYGRRFAEILVDELQDTSPAQLELIEELRGEETSLFRVGDELQSIYRFRHADLEGFRRLRTALAGGGDADVLALRGNFRSRAAILGLVNHLGSHLIDGFQALTVGSAEQAAREPRGGGSGVELIVTGPEGWEEAPNAPEAPEGHSAARAAEAGAVAERLGELAAAGVPRGEMVVMLRALTAAEPYATALERHGLRPFVVGGRGFWDERSVIDALALLGAIANPLDDEALMGALASPACAASPDSLWMLRRATGRGRPVWPAVEQAAGADRLAQLADPTWVDQLSSADREAIAELHGALCELREALPRIGLEELALRAVTITGQDLAALARPRGEASLAALNKLARLAGEYESAEGRDLRGFLDYAAVRAGEGDEAEAAVAAEGHDGVRVMTVHAAKGLEFPVVAVPELGRSLSDGGNAPAIRLSPQADGAGDDGPAVGLRLARIGRPPIKLFGMEKLTERERELDASEEMRLLHVALTRAEERLVLSGVAKPPPKDGISPATPVLTRILSHWGLEIDPEGPAPEIEPPTILPPSPREGLEAEASPIVPEIRVNWPLAPEDAGADRLAMATGDEAGPGAADEADRRDGGGPEEPPLLEPLPEPAPPLPRLSFTTLSAHAEDPAGSRRRRLLGLDGGAATAPLDPEATPASGERELELSDREPGEATGGGSGFGQAVHELLERSLRAGGARNRWRAPSRAEIEAALASTAGTASSTDTERAEAQIHGWIDSELCAETVAAGVALRTEVPFFHHLDLPGAPGAIVRGMIDLLAEPPRGAPLIVDYKSNRLEGRAPAEAAAAYELQKQIYAAAVARASGVEAVRVAFVFLEAPDDPVVADLDSAAIAAAETALQDRVSALLAPTGNPGARGCAPGPLPARPGAAP